MNRILTTLSRKSFQCLLKTPNVILRNTFSTNRSICFDKATAKKRYFIKGQLNTQISEVINV